MLWDKIEESSEKFRRFEVSLDPPRGEASRTWVLQGAAAASLQLQPAGGGGGTLLLPVPLQAELRVVVVEQVREAVFEPREHALTLQKRRSRTQVLTCQLSQADSGFGREN